MKFIQIPLRVLKKIISIVTRKVFSLSVRNVGKGGYVTPPFHIVGSQYIEIGDNFSAAAGLKIGALDEYAGVRYSPKIIIGNNVVLNLNCYIAAINHIEIGNNVLIGCDVLINDGSHGQLTSEELDIPPIKRILFSKGAIVIEDNVWIGKGACILSGVRIGKNAVIGANSVVTKDVLPRQIVGGVPAKVLRTIDENI